eukprot:jgi/Tetstr1/424919/TSEL_015412.t1
MRIPDQHLATGSRAALAAKLFGTTRDLLPSAAEVEAGGAALQGQLETDGPLDKQTLVGDAVKACCAALGRDHEEPEVQDMITWLKSNWYNTLGDLASMTVEEAAQLKVPLRMLNWMKEALGKDPAAQEGDTSITMDLSQVVGAIKASSVAESHGSHGKWVFTGETPAPLTKRKHLQPYSLPMKDCPERVNKELEAFYRFCTVKSFKRQTKTVAPVSAKRYCNLIRRMLGWMHYHQGVPLETLSIKDLIPSSDRAGAEKAFDFLTWLEMERGCSPRTLVLQAAAILVLGHYLFHEQSHASPSEGDKPYNDILAIRELRRLAKQVGEGSNNNTSVSNIEMKWIDWPQYLQVVNTLEGTYRDMAAAHKMDGSVPERQVAMALQQYLIFGILACIPDRQRTIRELEHGKTLIRTQDDRWVIRHSAEDYKTGKQYGDRPDLLISPYLYEDLEAWLSRYRAVLSPDHTRVFTGARGAAFSDSNFSAYFSKACYRVTGKRMNPHLVRDSIVTFLRRGDHSQKTLESLALYMGHSVAMQRDTYDRRTKKEKAAPAAELLIQQLMQTLDV